MVQRASVAGKRPSVVNLLPPAEAKAVCIISHDLARPFQGNSPLQNGLAHAFDVHAPHLNPFPGDERPLRDVRRPVVPWRGGRPGARGDRRVQRRPR